MGYCVLGNKGQNDGNKGNGDDAEHFETDVGKLRIGTIAVNLRFYFLPTIFAGYVKAECSSRRIQRRPRMFCARRRMSASTPAAVTAPPAPAPRTTIGYSL